MRYIIATCCVLIWHQLVDSQWRIPPKKCAALEHMELWWWCEAQAARVCVYFRLDGRVGGVLVGDDDDDDEWNLHVQRGSDQCHPIVPLWQSGRIAVSLPAQWQARLSWEWREALFCHAKSLKPSSFRLGNPQRCVAASAAERWQSRSQRTHAPGSLKLCRAATPKKRGRTAPLFDSMRKGLKAGSEGSLFSPCLRRLTQSERGHLLNVIMIIFSWRSVLLSVYYPQIFLILTSGSYL